MSDPYRKVPAGAPISMPASLYNELVDLALAQSKSRQAGSTESVGPSWSRAAAIVRVENVEDDDIDQGDAIGFDAPPFLPTDPGGAFFEQVILKSDPPASGKWGIAIEPIAKTFVGRVVVSGFVNAKITLADANDSGDFVEWEDDALRLGNSGSAKVIWREELTEEEQEGEGPFEKWAVIQLGVPIPADTDCPDFDCGLAVGAALPRSTATGVLRMFRGQRPTTSGALSKTNRPEKEIQFSVGFLGRWPDAKTARFMFPGLTYSSFTQPDSVLTFDNIGGAIDTQMRRHLVTRRHTAFFNAIEFDWSPPGYQGWLYVLGHQAPTIGPGGGSVTFSPRVLALRIYDGLVVGGRHFPQTVGGAAAGPLFTEPFTDSNLTYFDGGCCKKYDAVTTTDIYQGPNGYFSS